MESFPYCIHPSLAQLYPFADFNMCFFSPPSISVSNQARVPSSRRLSTEFEMECRFSYSSLYQQWFFHKCWLERGSGLIRCCPVPRALWPQGETTKSPCKWCCFNGVENKQEQNSGKTARSPSRRAPGLSLILWRCTCWFPVMESSWQAGAGTAQAAKECQGILHMAGCLPWLCATSCPWAKQLRLCPCLALCYSWGWGVGVVSWEHAGKDGSGRTWQCLSVWAEVQLWQRGKSSPWSGRREILQ